ncbi:hypothetical protein CVT24_007806 [Panaeolus cyanescens]|uniref:Cyanovirin-N domain-containing protein n=1 Tax=Panaeolus cyanescens TaxID=181874 RepID=A0A409W4Q0_9AGAR|nr:hypothetical protein CVT24_007806 [Panaeolus cyanescens]
MQLSNILPLVATAFALVHNVAARGDFSKSCTGIYLEGDHFLRATCANGQGGTTNSALDLNACMGISPTFNGNLDCIPNGNYAAFGCNTCLISHATFMVCSCPGNIRTVGDLGRCFRP